MGITRTLAAIAGVFALVVCAGCATPPQHPALAGAQAKGALPPLLPVRRFVANIDFSAGYSLSPDGRQLLWTQAVGTDVGLAVRPVSGGSASSFATGVLARADTTIYTWLADSRHVAYLTDRNGDENTQLHVFDSRVGFAPWTVTPWPGTRSLFTQRGEPGSTRFHFVSNRRDKATFDLYEADAATRTIREVARSDGTVLSWVLGTDSRLGARARRLGDKDGSDLAVELLQPDGSWRHWRTLKALDSMWFLRFDPAAGKAWGLSNIGRDKTALVEFDLATAQEKVLAADPDVDIWGGILPPLTGAPIGAIAHPGLPVARYFDASLAAELAAASRKAVDRGLIASPPVIVRPQSTSNANDRMVLRAEGEFDVAELLLDRKTGEVMRLDRRETDNAALLAAEKPFSFKASDGRTLHGYFIRPRGVQGPAPLVVQIHGGPWARDLWRPATFNTDQLLANRGYAVLTVNYRGSSGYGRDFLLAGNREYNGRLQQDVAEATQWAIDQGVADPKRMAVLGASFGGFSVMAQLIQQQHDWRCGVNVVGAANWPRLIENWPPFWRNRHMFEMMFGDVANPDERALMLANSPVSRVDRITAPMLVIHGANDIRVMRQDSDDVVAELKRLGRPVEFLSFPNEGHQVRRWRNRLEMWRRIEDTLASCLGGRSAGWDFYQLVPR